MEQWGAKEAEETSSDTRPGQNHLSDLPVRAYMRKRPGTSVFAFGPEIEDAMNPLRFSAFEPLISNRSVEGRKRRTYVPLQEKVPLRKPLSKQIQCFMIFTKCPISRLFITSCRPENGSKMNFATEPAKAHSVAMVAFAIGSIAA